MPSIASQESATPLVKKFPLHNLIEVILVSLKIGILGFGGPAAHVAFMHREIVQRRRWVDETHFMEMLAATNLIPGPNSTEMMIHLGYLRAGWAGWLLGGLGFILPAMTIVLVIARLYVLYGQAPLIGGLLYGIKPVILSIILDALWKLKNSAFKRSETILIGVAAFTLYLLGINELVILFGSGLVILAIDLTRRNLRTLPVVILPGWLPDLAAFTAQPFSLGLMFMTFLKIGAVLYGSGYVLLAFIRSDLVIRLGWMTDQQLLDAIAVGQLTPGPVFTTATFIGYLLGGIPGGLVATAGIFLPSFIFVAGLSQVLPRLKEFPLVKSILDGVIASSIALMAGVTLQIGRSAVIDVWTAGLAIISILLIGRYKLNTTYVILIGAAAGIIRSFI